uniref:Upstream stimulatory factor 1 n=1 Tax=Salmo trutta TaxID=8032 RepID=A0A674E8R3_SALTR
MKGQQKSPDDDGDVPIIDEGAVATADDPTAITTIQSAATFSSDQPIKYLFKTEGGGLPVGELYPPSGQVTYRVIQVSDGQVDGQTDGASAVSVVTGFPATTQTVTQAVFSQSEGLEGEASETHYYYPVTDATQATMVENVQAPETLLTQSTPTGQLYVMMSPQDVLGGTNQSKSEPPRTSRDDKRRAQHNEVERRRRDKINNWIVQLSKTIPDCTLDATKNGQSKGGILSKACDYIQELRQSNARLGEDLENLERLRMDNQLLRQEVDDWKTKNQMMRSQLRQNGIVGAAGRMYLESIRTWSRMLWATVGIRQHWSVEAVVCRGLLPTNLDGTFLGSTP